MTIRALMPGLGLFALVACTPKPTVKPTPPTPAATHEQVTDAVAAGLLSGETEAFEAALGGPVTIEIEPSGQSKTITEVLADAAAFKAWLARTQPCLDPGGSQADERADCVAYNGLVVPGARTCAEGCCVFTEPGRDEIMVAHGAWFLQRVCFAGDKLSAIHIIDGD